MTAAILHFESREAMHAYVRGEPVAFAVVSGGKVRPHAQAFADYVADNFEIGVIGTYPGHRPSRDRAIDIFPRSRAEGDRLAEWATQDEVIDRFGLDYHMWWRQIYNRDVARHWRPVEDRGSPTANHEDHGHFGFDETGAAAPEEDDMFTDEDRALLRDVATGLAEWKTGGLPSPVLDAIQRRLDAIENKVTGSGGVTAGTFKVSGTLEVTDKERGK